MSEGAHDSLATREFDSASVALKALDLSQGAFHTQMTNLSKMVIARRLLSRLGQMPGMALSSDLPSTTPLKQARLSVGLDHRVADPERFVIAHIERMVDLIVETAAGKPFVLVDALRVSIASPEDRGSIKITWQQNIRVLDAPVLGDGR